MSSPSPHSEGGKKWFPHNYNPQVSSPTTQDKALPALITELVWKGASVSVTASAGAGKTFLAQYVVTQLKSKGEFVILFDVAKASKEGLDSDQRMAKYLVREKHIKPEEESRFLQCVQRVVFVFDHLDEFCCSPENVYLKQLLAGPTQPCARLFLARQTHPEIISATKHFTLSGFDCFQTALNFVEHELSVVHSVSRIQPLLQYLRSHPVVADLCIIPRMGEIIAIVYAKDNKCIKDTETLVVHKMMIEWLKKVIPHLSVNSLYKLPAETKEHLLHFAQIAYLSLSYPANKEGSFSLADKEISYVNLQVGHSSLDHVNHFGLVLCSGMTVHRFLHEIVQEFLAAFYLSSLPQDEQISFYYEHFPKSIDRFLRVCLFQFGLTRLETELFLNPSKIILAGMIESLAHVTQKQEGRRYLELQKLIYACLYEAQDETLVKTFCQQYTSLMEMTLDDDKALDNLRLTTQVAYVIVKSEINSWEVKISDEKFRQQTNALVFPISSAVTDRVIKVTVIVQPNQSAAYIVKPIFKPKQPKRTGRATEMMKRAQNEQESEMYFQHAMVCTGQRETLHRVTQLYSPVTVRSDAGDPAYASLITCECVEQKLQDYVVFEPIHPIHTVQLSSKSRKTKGPDGERDATTWKHVEETHKKNYLEIIVLNKPSVKSITFQPPGSAQQCRLVMSSEKVSPCVPGRITMEAEKSLIDPTNSVRCMPVEESGGTSSSMVAHGLPLPKSKTKVEVDKINVLQTEETAGVRFHDALEVPVTAAQAAPSHKHFQDGDFNLYTPVPAQAESTEKVTWRPGMIMFTV